MEFTVGDLLTRVATNIPDREAIIMGEMRLTFKDVNERANQAAHLLLKAGASKGDNIGILGYNCIEWIEVMLGCFKIGARPINLNFRYVEEELHYVFNDADLTTLAYQKSFTPVLKSIADQYGPLANYLMIDDASDADASVLPHTHYSLQVREQDCSNQGLPALSGDDLYILYTGGTTGMPKGVMWRQEDVIMTLGGGMDVESAVPIESPELMADRCLKPDAHPMKSLLVAPLMHGAAQWVVMRALFEGNISVLSERQSFDPEYVWQMVEREKLNMLFLTGDAMAKPLMDTYETGDYDVSSLFVIVSSAAVFSPALKDKYVETFPNAIILDNVGASEVGFFGASVHQKNDQNAKDLGGGPRVKPGKNVVILDDDLTLIEPGSEKVGQLARGGFIPLGYYNDEKKTKETFVIAADGKRYSIPGDMAVYHADGTMTLLGRGSTCINSGGEKIYPEEVEGAVKAHSSVMDALVVATPDDRWGSAVTALIEVAKDIEAPSLEDIQQTCSEHIARYKYPRRLYRVDAIKRSPSGKPDYKWAKATALDAYNQQLTSQQEA